VAESLKPLDWIGSSKKDLLAMPEEVIDLFGYALHLAQEGRKHDAAKPLQGFGSAGVVEVVTSQRGDAFRAVYTVRFADVVYVLHCFQKKSRKGIGTPQPDMDLIRSRLSQAESRYKEIAHGPSKGKWAKDKKAKGKS
jgi:phage-related protein